MIFIFIILGAAIGWFMSQRDGESELQGALIGAVGGALGGLGFWVVVKLLGLLAGALGAIAGAVALVWLYNRWRSL